MTVPADLYARSPRVYRGLEELTYPLHDQTIDGPTRVRFPKGSPNEGINRDTTAQALLAPRPHPERQGSEGIALVAVEADRNEEEDASLHSADRDVLLTEVDLQLSPGWGLDAHCREGGGALRHRVQISTSISRITRLRRSRWSA